MSANDNPMTPKDHAALAVLDAFSAMPNQVCCGNSVGGGMDDRGNGDSPSCCGSPVDTDMLKEARAHLAQRLEAAEGLAEAMKELDSAEADLRYGYPPGTILSLHDPKVARITAAQAQCKAAIAAWEATK